jgi:predicted nucleic acid-binding protein
MGLAWPAAPEHRPKRLDVIAYVYIALARIASADYPVSGDRHLLDLADPEPPVLSPRQFVDLLGA